MNEINDLLRKISKINSFSMNTMNTINQIIESDIYELARAMYISKLKIYGELRDQFQLKDFCARTCALCSVTLFSNPFLIAHLPANKYMDNLEQYIEISRNYLDRYLPIICCECLECLEDQDCDFYYIFKSNYFIFDRIAFTAYIRYIEKYIQYWDILQEGYIDLELKNEGFTYEGHLHHMIGKIEDLSLDLHSYDKFEFLPEKYRR